MPNTVYCRWIAAKMTELKSNAPTAPIRLAAQPLHGPPQPKVAAREGVRVARGPHQDVGDGPRADAGQFREAAGGFLRVGSGVEVHPAVGARSRQRAQRHLPAGGEPETGQIGAGAWMP